MQLYLAYLIGANLAGLLFYGYDKLCARAGCQRIPERTLLGLSLAGGAVGGLVAMLLMRHKIRKPVFFVAQAVGIVAHIVIVIVWWLR
jgi:uncharacterized membrane protein YsdA (DUF1294 family)